MGLKEIHQRRGMLDPTSERPLWPSPTFYRRKYSKFIKTSPEFEEGRRSNSHVGDKDQIGYDAKFLWKPLLFLIRSISVYVSKGLGRVYMCVYIFILDICVHTSDSSNFKCEIQNSVHTTDQVNFFFDKSHSKKMFSFSFCIVSNLLLLFFN